jgi:hypothetical protein
MTRPRGQFRAVIGQAFAQFGERGATWRDAAERSGVAWSAAKYTVRDMARAGELAVVGAVQVQGIRRPMLAYVAVDPPSAPGADLAEVIRGWADFR